MHWGTVCTNLNSPARMPGFKPSHLLRAGWTPWNEFTLPLWAQVLPGIHCATTSVLPALGSCGCLVSGIVAGLPSVFTVRCDFFHSPYVGGILGPEWECAAYLDNVISAESGLLLRSDFSSTFLHPFCHFLVWILPGMAPQLHSPLL